MRGFESLDVAQRDHSPDRLNANCIKAALAFVHFHEATGGLAVALEKLLTLGPVVTRPEYEALCRAVHFEPSQVPLAKTRWYP